MTLPYNTIGSYLPSSYQKYVPQAFDDSLNLYEQMTALIAFLNGVVDQFNTLSESASQDIQTAIDLVTALNNAVETFKTEMQEEVLPGNIAFILDEWLASGKLATILTEELLTNKANVVDLETLETTVTAMGVQVTNGLADLDTELETALAELNGTVGSKLNHLLVPVTDYLTVAEKADIALVTPVLDLSVSIQAYVTAMRARKQYTLYFPKGNYRFKNINLGSDPWYLKGESSLNGYIHDTALIVIAASGSVGFLSNATNIALSDFTATTNGNRTDGLNVTFYKNSLAAGHFLSAKRIYAVGFSGALLDALDVIDSIVSDIHADDLGTIAKFRISAWTRNTTVTFHKLYALRCTKALDVPNTTESVIKESIFEFCTSAGDLTSGVWTVQDCYFEYNTVGFNLDNSQVIDINNFFFQGADTWTNNQSGLDYLHRGEAQLYKGGGHFSRFSKHYTIAANRLDNNGETSLWHKIGVWYPQGGGCRLALSFLGASGFSQQSNGDGLSGGNGKTRVFATYAGNANPSLPSVTAFAYHEGSNKPVTAVKIVAKDQYFDKFDIFIQLATYASKIGYEVETTTGYYMKEEALNTTDPGSANANLVNVPFEYKIMTDTGSFEVTADGGLKLVAPVVAGGTAPATVDNYMWVQIGGSYYKVPLYL